MARLENNSGTGSGGYAKATRGGFYAALPLGEQKQRLTELATVFLRLGATSLAVRLPILP